jgi:myo-inositol 2-dehydrogenase / D-chiro-inositol 1-dehydrogenase
MRIAVIGSGRMATLRARLLAADPEVDEVLLTGRNQAAVAELAHQLGLAVVTSGDLFDGDLDGIVITTATVGHRDLLRAALEAGITTFCEKPLTLNPVETLEIVQLAAKRSVQLQVGYHRRFDPGMRALHDAVRSGAAGTLYSIRLLSLDHAPSPPDFIGSSGGIFRDLHVHDFDLLRWLTGLEVVSVFATGSIRLHERFAPSGDCDTAVMLVTLSDGLVASVHGARDDPLGQDVRVEVFGSHDSLTAGLNPRTPLRAAGEALPWPAAEPYRTFADRFAAAFEAETSSFVDLLAGRVPNQCPPSEDLAAMRVAEACEVSRREGRVVSLECLE